MSKEKSWILRVVRSIGEIEPGQWDACANPGACDSHQTIPFDPFVSFAYLKALEESRSAIGETGWAPYHLSVEDEQGMSAGVMPMYLKSHSLGEYVFDWGWADAFERAGGRYYPKLQVSVPFTPVTGRRLLIRPGEHESAVEDCLSRGALQVARKLEVSSLHVTFAAREQWARLGDLGFLLRTDQQFYWQNRGYGSFADFLAGLSSKKRKNIKRERRVALENDIAIERLTGKDITEAHWDAFFRFYRDTGSRKWGTPYLTRRFFSVIGETMDDRILLIMCKRNGYYVAGALNFIGSDCLFGRNWGCIENHPFLHFEVCYYQAIEFAIDNGLARVEAGAQGEHKLARGYLPEHTYSAHWIANPGFRDAIDDFLTSERRYISQEVEFLKEHTPFRKAP